jgi:hypothetical protein
MTFSGDKNIYPGDEFLFSRVEIIFSGDDKFGVEKSIQEISVSFRGVKGFGEIESLSRTQKFILNNFFLTHDTICKNLQKSL